MPILAIQRESIEPRIDGIQRDLALLREYATFSFKKFNDPIILDRTHLRLRFILEGIFHIGSHLLARSAGGRFTEYREIALKLGDQGIVSKKFARDILAKMAGYRNRLTHLYAQVTSKELYDILNKHLDDVDIFLKAIKKVLTNPKKYGFRIE